MGIGLSVLLLYLSRTPYPPRQHPGQARHLQEHGRDVLQVFKKDREFNNNRWPFLIKVKDVQDKLDDRRRTFKHLRRRRRTRTASIWSSRPRCAESASIRERASPASISTAPRSPIPARTSR